MADITLRSRQSILGAFIARIKAETDINDMTPGSAILTILEAAASSDFLTEAKLLQLLNTRNLDKATGVDLENLAFEMGVSPNRIGAGPATASVTILENAFVKKATNVYAGSIAPAAGDTVVRVVDASEFDAAGTIYIGRGTATSESLNYISLTNTGSYWQLILASALQKDHLVGEEVVLAQGGARQVTAGTTVQAAGQSGRTGATFTTQYDVTLADGEDKLTGVLTIATEPGSQGNVGRSKIISFQSAPWTTAGVTNPDAAAGGLDPETDAELRQRIKDHVHSLSGGTERAIIRAVVGVSDDVENKRVVSAFLKRPTSATDQTTLFIDDGTGFAPSFAGIGEEVIVTSAIGTEQFFQLQQWPLVKAQVASVAIEPFNLTGGQSLYVEVDGLVEEKVLPSSSYRTPGVVTAQEVAEAINKLFTSIEARAKDGQLFITPTASDPDWIRVGTATSADGDVNGAIRFPTRKQYTIRLYKNDRLLEKNGSEAVAQSLTNAQWTGLTGTETLQFNVDGIDSPIITFTNLDFATYTSSTTISGATVNDWVIMINRKFIGVTAVARDDGSFVVKSNRGRTNVAHIAIIGGSAAGKLFPAESISSGRQPEYKINRLLGQIELTSRMVSGDELKAGNTNTRGFALTSALAAFNLQAVNSHAPEMVVIADFPYVQVATAQVGNVLFTVPSANVSRITGVTGQFSLVKRDDFCHLYNLPRHALLRVSAVDAAGGWVEFTDPTPSTGSATLDGTSNQMRFFRTEGLPQLLVLPTGTQVFAATIVAAITAQILGVTAEVIDTGAIRIQTTRFSGDGALAFPSIAGNASNLGILEGNFGSNDPHTAAIESDDLAGLPSKRITISADDITQAYDDLEANGTPFGAPESNRDILTYLGSASRVLRNVQERTSPSHLVLREELPKQTIAIGKDMRAASMSGMEFGQSDNMVFLIDNDPATKTFDIPMYVEGTISGPSVPTTTQFDALDATGAALGTSTRWLGHKFEDYRVWFQAKGDLISSSANSSIRVNAVPFGPNGERIKVGTFYPTQPSAPASIAFTADGANDQILVNIALASGNARIVSIQPNRRVDLDYDSVNHTTRIHFLAPVDLTAVVLGDVLTLSDSAFSSLNQGQMRIQSLANQTDVGHAFQFLEESTQVDVNGGVNLYFNSVPAQAVRVGDKVKIGSVQYLVNTVTDAQHVIVDAPGFTDGAAQSSTLKHSCITISAAPSFAAAPGDRIVVGSTVLVISQVTSPTVFAVDAPFAFTGLQSGVMSRIYVQGVRYSGVSESALTSSSSGIQIYDLPAASNKAGALIALIGATAGIKDIISASNASGSTGAGSVSKSTEEETGSRYVSLSNGESYVYSTSGTSPGIRLKEPSSRAVELGEKVRFVPSSPRSIARHFSRKQISGGLTVAAEVQLVDKGRRVQISSKTTGGLGQVYAVGGRASGQNVLNIRGNAQVINASRAQIELDRSSIDLLVPGHTIKITQSGRAKKDYPVSAPTSATTIEMQIPAVGEGMLLISTPLVQLYSYAQTGSPQWAVRNIGRKRIRFEILQGVATIPANVKVDDWVLVGSGLSYAGITTDTPFAPANRGWFQIRETDNATYFDVDGVGVEEFVNSTANTFIFCSYHSVRPGDQLQIGFDAPVSTANKGTFTVLSVPAAGQVVYANPNIELQAAIALGLNGVGSLGVLDQGYSTYRKVVMVSPKPSDPTGRSIAVVSPGYDMSLLSEGQGSKVRLPNRLNYGTDPVPGVAGYLYYTGLLRSVQRVLTGYEPNSAAFQGVAAAGVDIEPRPPQKQQIVISMKVKTANGVSLQALSDTIKSAIQGYVNSLKLGSDVVMSEVIKIVQEIPGVDACVLAFPTPGTERVTVGDNSIARITSNDITLS